MDFITLDDCTADAILVCEESDVIFANAYLLALAKKYGLKDDEIAIPCNEMVRQLGVKKAYQTRALAMVGNDTTVMADGSRGDDVFKQKYELYTSTIGSIEERLTFSDFAIDGVNESGKGGVGVIRLTRA